MSKYQAERDYFASFKQNVPAEAIFEYETAIHTLHERYNTTIYENRFIVGGAVEVFTLLLLRTAGIPVDAYGSETAAGDLILPKNRMLSIKGSFTGKRDNIRLVNVMKGSSETPLPEWKTATLFVLTGIGIVYGDPDMLKDGDLVYNEDSLSLKRSAVDRFRENPDNLKTVSIAPKQPKQMTRFSHKASTAVARQILYEQKADKLLGQIGST